jgi:hypothetical protein
VRMRQHACALAQAALALAVVSALTSCSEPRDGEIWTGGQVTPTPIAVQLESGPSGSIAAIPTGVVVGDHEMLLYVWGDGNRNLDSAWRAVRTGEVVRAQEHLVPGGAYQLGAASGSLFGLTQLVVDDGRVVEFGGFRGAVGRITVEFDGRMVDTRFVRLTEPETLTLFWSERRGRPIPENSPSGEGRWVPLEPGAYPLVTVFGPSGTSVETARIRPPATEQKV